jgi:hypothetical protein
VRWFEQGEGWKMGERFNSAVIGQNECGKYIVEASFDEQNKAYKFELDNLKRLIVYAGEWK